MNERAKGPNKRQRWPDRALERVACKRTEARKMERRRKKAKEVKPRCFMTEQEKEGVFFKST